MDKKKVCKSIGYSEERFNRLLDNKEKHIPLREVHKFCDLFDISINKLFE